MDKVLTRAITYSLLAHIRNTGQLSKGPIDIFVPLVKRVLSRLNDNKLYSGESILEIQNETQLLYGVDFPLPVLRSILTQLAREVNTENETLFLLHQDDSFIIKNYSFVEFDDTIRVFKLEIDNIEKLFKQFCETSGNVCHSYSLIEFIERNKSGLSKYLAHKNKDTHGEYSVEAQFVEYFKTVPSVYEIIRKIYLGAVLSTYIEYKPEIIKTEIELVLDTNFILGFLDLNTKESTHTCQKIIEIAKSQGYRLTVLQDTITETTNLLRAKAENYNLTFLQKKVYPEDIYNACERRGLTKTDLERTADNLTSILSGFGILIIYDTTKYKNIAKFSNEYDTFKKFRSSHMAALHDATAIHYVRERRARKIKEFEDVNCWFINNSISRDRYIDKSDQKIEFQPEAIKADEFLNILWLSNPQVSASLSPIELSEIGLTSLISMSLLDSLPKLSIIRELDDNIQKYARDNEITDGDIVRIATRITTKQLKDLDGLNRLAQTNREEFVKRVQEEATKQKELDIEKLKKLDEVISKLSAKTDQMSKMKAELSMKSEAIRADIEEIKKETVQKDSEIDNLKQQLKAETLKVEKYEKSTREKKREEFVDSVVRKWRRATDYELSFLVVIFIVSIIIGLSLSNWSLEQAKINYKSFKSGIVGTSLLALFSLFFTSLTFKKWYDKRYNHSNIENFKKGLKIPDSLKD